jgi:hypothetical protein
MTYGRAHCAGAASCSAISLAFFVQQCVSNIARLLHKMLNLLFNFRENNSE